MTKLSIGQAWTETIAAVKREGRLIVPVALAFAVIPATLFALAVPPVPAGQIREPGLWMVLYPLLILAALIGQMAIMLPIAMPVLANPTSPPPAAALLFLAACIVLLCLWVRLILMTASGVAENIGPVAIVKRSWSLTRGNFWRLLAATILFGIVAWIAISAVEWVLGSVLIVALGKPEPWTVSALLIALIAAIAQTIASVLFAVLLARIYVQLAG